MYLGNPNEPTGTGVIVSRLDIDGPAGLVKGVHIQPSQGNENDRNFSVKASREVILCSGAICTPQILLLSGIGPKTAGSQTDDSPNIPLVKELPAVGTMFSDHYSFPIMLELPKKETFHVLESIWGLWHMILWMFVGKGLFAQTAMATAAYVRTGAIDPETMSIRTRQEDGTDNMDASEPANRPDVEIMVMPINGLERQVPGHALFNLHPTIIQPHATGSITLVSTSRTFTSMLK
jgi:choline dehydrogenase-like flavoprotein